MAISISQGVTSLWSTQHQVHPGRTVAHLKPREEGAQAEDLLTMEGAGAVTAEADTTDETLEALYGGIRGLLALYAPVVIDPPAEGFPEALPPELRPACHHSAVFLLPKALHEPSARHQGWKTAKALQQFLT